MANSSKPSDNYPKIVELSRNKKPFKIDPKDPNFYRPLSSLTKDYGPNPNHVLTLILK